MSIMSPKRLLFTCSRFLFSHSTRILLIIVEIHSVFAHLLRSLHLPLIYLQPLEASTRHTRVLSLYSPSCRLDSSILTNRKSSDGKLPHQVAKQTQSN